MIIEENIKKITFGGLEYGDIFRYGSIYYIKIPPCECNGRGYNSYDLINNDYCYFSADHKEIIIPTTAKLVIE